MKLEIEVPPKEVILSDGTELKLAPKGKSWSKKNLGNHKNERGVYIIHHDKKIRYVGKTDGPTMNFGIRLRREFQETASQGKHNYPRLKKLQTPPPIYVCFFNTDDLRELIKTTIANFESSDQGIIETMEQVFICAYEPEWQRGISNL